MRVSDTINLDHQASTPVDPEVFEAMKPYLVGNVGNPHSSDHALGWKSTQAIEKAKKHVATLVGAAADEVFFTSGATEANNMALLGLARRAPGVGRRRVLLGATEHKCVLAVGDIIREQLGFEVELVPVDKFGRLDLNSLESMISSDVLFVSAMSTNNEIGTIQDISEISSILERHQILYHCDASQSPTAHDIRNLASKCDLISLSSHKMYGPMGIGVLIVRRDVQEHIEPLIYGGGQQAGLRSGTLPTPLCIGMGEAARLITIDAQNKRRQLSEKRDLFVSQLEAALGASIRVNGPISSSERHPGNASISFLGHDAHSILMSLQPKLAASTGSACASGQPESSHVLRAIGLSKDIADSTIRFSLGYNTTDEDIGIAVELLRELIDRSGSGTIATAE